MFTPDQQRRFDELEQRAEEDEETVLFMSVTVTNTAPVPRYAFVKLPVPASDVPREPVPYTYDSSTGTARYAEDRVFSVASLDGQPIAHEEVCVLVPPADAVLFDIRVPHRPISTVRADRLRQRSMDEVLARCRDHWRAKLRAGAKIEVPERRLTEMLAAGSLHLDLVAYGSEPSGTLAPTIGIYSPIGSESAPIIQFFDSIGWTRIAERSCSTSSTSSTTTASCRTSVATCWRRRPPCGRWVSTSATPGT